MGRLDYLEQYMGTGTSANYRSALRIFFEAVYGQREPLGDLAESYFQEDRNHEEDVQKFLVSLKPEVLNF